MKDARLDCARSRSDDVRMEVTGDAKTVVLTKLEHFFKSYGSRCSSCVSDQTRGDYCWHRGHFQG